MNRLSRFVVFAIAAVVLAAAGFVVWKKTQKEPMRVVAIATLVSHPALDSLLENVKTQLAAEGFRDGENIRIAGRLD